MKLFDIIKKDLNLVLTDPKSMVFIIIMPIVLILILSFSLGGSFEEEGFTLDIINIGVVDNITDDEIALLESMPLDQSIIDSVSLYTLLDDENLNEIITYEKMTQEQANTKLETREVDAVVIIPETYLRTTLMGIQTGNGETQIEVISAQNRSLQTNIVTSVISGYTSFLSSLSADNVVLNSYLDNPNIFEYVAELEEFNLNNQLTIEAQGVNQRKMMNQFYYYSIAITCMFVLFSAGQGSTFLLNESNDKTLQRLFVAGVSKAKLLVGKSFAVFSLCVIQLIVLFIFSTIAFSLNWGNPWIFLLISLCLAFSVTGIGALLMVLSYKGNSHNLGNMFQSVFVQVLALFGGSYIPLAVLPKFFSSVALFTPNGLGIIAYSENVQGAPLNEIYPYILGNLALGIVFCTIAVYLFNKKRRVD